MDAIVGTVYCEQRVVFDRRYGRARSADLAAKARAGTFEHFKFELEGYTRSPLRLLRKMAVDRGRVQPRVGDRRCFIATHIYGGDAPQTQTLREWRDHVLVPHRLGRLVVAVYYRASPALVQLMPLSPFLSRVLRSIVDRHVARLERMQ